MPCYTTTVTTVNIGKVNIDRMEEAMKADGWKVSRERGILVGRRGMDRVAIEPGSDQMAVVAENPAATRAAIKRAYAAKTVAEAARKHGWNVQGEKNQGTTIQMKLGRPR